jgi:hypothetical protein
MRRDLALFRANAPASRWTLAFAGGTAKRGAGPIPAAPAKAGVHAAEPPHRLFRLLLALLPLALLLATPARAETVAVLQGLDKTTARISKFDAPVGKPVRFGRLVITVRACIKHPPEEEPESAAFLQIDELRQSDHNAVAQRVFSGWMFASSPALSALENPIYDVGVLDCKSDTTAAPASGSAGK